MTEMRLSHPSLLPLYSKSLSHTHNRILSSILRSVTSPSLHFLFSISKGAESYYYYVTDNSSFVSACVKGTDCTDCGGVDAIPDYSKVSHLCNSQVCIR